MSTIYILASPDITMNDIKILRDAGGGSYTAIKQAAQSGQPVAAYDLFHNNHDEAAHALRKIISHFGNHLSYYELLDNEDFKSAEDHINHKKQPGIIINILDSYDEDSYESVFSTNYN